MRIPIGAVLLPVFLAACYGCAVAPVPGSVAGGAAAETDASRGVPQWWYARFRIRWPDGDDPAWHVDALLADCVVRPALLLQQSAIPLWRFHRRAIRDAAGHQFSFVFYANRRAGAGISEMLRSDTLLRALQENGIVLEWNLDAPAPGDRAGLADASDDNWPRALQIAWPHYLMGASATWLGLLAEVRGPDPQPRPDVDSLLQRYRGINEAVSLIWRAQGQHAFLHHLNALFGYEPLLIQKELEF